SSIRRFAEGRAIKIHVCSGSLADVGAGIADCPLCAMCGRLRVGKSFLWGLAGAAMCSRPTVATVCIWLLRFVGVAEGAVHNIKSEHSAVWLKTSLFDHLVGAVATVARAEPLRAWLLGWSNPAYDQFYERSGIVMFDIRVDARWHRPWCIAAPCVTRTLS